MRICYKAIFLVLAAALQIAIIRPALAAPVIYVNNISVSPQAVTQGGMVQISANVVAGQITLNQLTSKIDITSFDGGVVYSTMSISLGDRPVSAPTPISIAYTVPSTLANGLYSVSLAFTTTTPNVVVAPVTQAVVFRVGPSIKVNPNLPTAHLTFFDEFKGAKMSHVLWTPSFPFPANPNLFEAQSYIPAAVSLVSGGGVRLTATKSIEPANAATKITSGALSAFGSLAQRYGHFEMKAKLPAGDGIWPAFWMLPEDQSWPPELDVMEYVGSQPYTIYSTLHWLDPNGTPQQESSSYNGPNFSHDYHVYAVDWRPDVIIFLIDGVERSRQTANLPIKPLYMLINLAVSAGGWVGSYDSTTAFPANLDIAYVSVYQFDDLTNPPPPNLKFRKTIVSNTNPLIGQTIQIMGGFDTGQFDLSNLTLHVFIRTYDGSTQVAYVQKPIGYTLRNSVVPFALSFTVPSTLAPGIYNIAYAVTTSNYGNIYLNVAERLVVGNSAPQL